VRHSFALAVTSFSLVVLAAPSAQAHIELTSPTPRYDDQKEGPCGRGKTDKRTTNITTFAPGEKITVTWTETVNHPGHYRISFDPDGTSAFVDPKSFTDLNTAPSVLVDGIADTPGKKTYSQEVTLPDVECDNCTLQVVQVMTDKAPYGNGDDLYYQCADLVLTRGATEEDAGSSGSSGADASAPPPSSGSSTSSGCATAAVGRPLAAFGGVSLAGLLGLAALGVAGPRRRRRR